MTTDDEHRELTGLLELITEILRNFAACASEDFDAAVDDALARIGNYTGVDRSYSFLLNDDDQRIDNTHEWCAAGIDPQIDVFQNVPTSLLPYWFPLLRKGQAVYIPDVHAIPDERLEEREMFVSHGIKSLVAVPLMSGNRLVGFLGFDSVREQRGWSDGAVLLLRAVAGVIGGGLERRRAFDALHTSEQRYRALMRHSSDVVMVLSENAILREVSASATAVLGWEETGRAGNSYMEAIHPDDAFEVLAALARATGEPGSPVTIPDHRLRHADGSWRWFLATAVDLGADPAIGGMVVNAHDITARKYAEEALEHQALHDPLSGLPNRALLLDRLQQALARAERTLESVGVIFLDLDRFKLVNDSLGHTIGDELLGEVAKRLLGNIRSEDTVARFGGDEFVVLLDRLSDPDEAQLGCDRLLEAFRAPFTLEGRDHVVTASAGLVISDGTSDAESLLRDADAAMYQAKERGRDRTQHFDAPLRDRLLLRVELGNDLRGSAERGELSLAFQPLGDLREDRIVGAEALLRWKHPTHGSIPPSDFIPLAEESGLILPIGAWVLGEALRQLRSWQDSDPALDGLTVAVNLSVHQLTDCDLPMIVTRLLEEHGLAPHRLCLELTESTLMAEPEAGLAVLGELRSLGVRLAIDDFGTGYSSLAYMRELPVTTLKIDRSFVTGLGHDNRDSRVIAAMIGLAHEFGMTTVAEGVETRAQLDELRTLGCDLVQGYFLQRPVPADELHAMLLAPDDIAERLCGSPLGALS